MNFVMRIVTSLLNVTAALTHNDITFIGNKQWNKDFCLNSIPNQRIPLEHCTNLFLCVVVKLSTLNFLFLNERNIESINAEKNAAKLNDL